MEATSYHQRILNKVKSLFDASQPEIFIYSQAIRSGKTTTLQHLLNSQKNVAGFLTPDVNGVRMLYDLETHQYLPFQVPGTDECQKPILQIGRFQFYEEAFARARHTLQNCITQHVDLLVIDEVGPLELQKKGFEPAVSTLIQAQRDGKMKSNLLLVVRDALLDQVVQHFQVDNFRRVNF